MVHQGRAEYIIEDVAGCGPFQIIFYTVIVVMVKLPISYNTIFMAFGNYNPGWRCLDNVTSSIFANETGLVISAGNESKENSKYTIDSCDDYRKCDDVEFDPDTSTIVTQWGLVCDQSWAGSVIISMQMLGLLIGAYTGGHLSDRIGRKKTVCIGLVVCSFSQIVSTFSVSWIMFAVFKFLIGLFAMNNNIALSLYMAEFMTRKWRAISISVPIWSVGATLMAFVAWITRDWRQIQYVGFCMTTVCILPFVIWVPESLRWLEVKNKRKEFNDVSRKILRMNKRHDISFEQPILLRNEIGKTDSTKYNIFDLFRKGYRVISVCIIFLYFSFSLLYYAVSFGAKSFYGNFYFNLAMINVIPFPILVLSLFAMRVMRRRQYTVTCLSITVVLSLVSIIILLAGDPSAKEFGSTVLICAAMATLDAAWSGVIVSTAEQYPTVVRGIGLGMGSVAARVGGVLAPFLIPDNEGVLYILMIVMAVLTIVCCGICLKLPETKGKSLKETFDDEENEDTDANEPVV